MMARNGQEATASRARGSTGKLMWGSEKNGPARTASGATPFKAAVAATAEDAIRNLRRERQGISTPLLDGGRPGPKPRRYHIPLGPDSEFSLFRFPSPAL